MRLISWTLRSGSEHLGRWSGLKLASFQFPLTHLWKKQVIVVFLLHLKVHLLPLETGQSHAVKPNSIADSNCMKQIQLVREFSKLQVEISSFSPGVVNIWRYVFSPYWAQEQSLDFQSLYRQTGWSHYLFGIRQCFSTKILNPLVDLRYWVPLNVRVFYGKSSHVCALEKIPAAVAIDLCCRHRRIWLDFYEDDMLPWVLSRIHIQQEIPYYTLQVPVGSGVI
jgi:hypothetical protein